jgi:hypothetical protein
MVGAELFFQIILCPKQSNDAKQDKEDAHADFIDINKPTEND